MATAGALVGAVAGLLVIRQADLDTLGLVVGVLVAVAAGTGLAMLLVGRGARPRAATPRHGPTEAPPPVPGPVRGSPPRLVLSTGTGSRWWDQQPARPAALAAGSSDRPVAPELTSYVDSAQVVQCPRCGAFRIDVHQVAGVFAFRCRVDDHTWEWRPGAGWPATVVLSRRRPERD